MEPPTRPDGPWPLEPTEPWATPSAVPGPPPARDPWSGRPALDGPAPDPAPARGWTEPGDGSTSPNRPGSGPELGRAPGPPTDPGTTPAAPWGPPPSGPPVAPAPPGWAPPTGTAPAPSVGAPPGPWSGPPAWPADPAPGWPPPGAPSGPPWGIEPTSPPWMGFDPLAPAPRWGMPDILLGLLAWLLLQIVGVLAISLFTSDAAVLSIGGLAASWVGMVGYLVFISRRKGFRSLAVDFGFRFQWIDPVLGFGIGLATLFASAIVRVIIANLFSEAPEGNAERIFGAVQDNKVALVVLALMAAIGAPLVEELFFRGLALRAISRRLGDVAAVLGSSFIFAVLHFQGGTTASVLGLFLGILIYGLVFAMTARLSGRLGPSVFAHMTINGLAAAVLIYTTFSGTPLGP